MRKKFIIPLFLILFISGCDNFKKEDKHEVATSKSLVVPAFNADSAYIFIKKQVDFGPRVPNTPEHFACGNYLIKQLESYGALVIVQEFKVKAYDNTILNLRNIIGSFNPSAKKRILLAAHWDTRFVADRDEAYSNLPIASLKQTDLLQTTPDIPFDGANDGASGVGVLLEIARLYNYYLTSAKSSEIDSAGKRKKTSSRVPGIDIIFFDGEDYGQPDDGTPKQKDTWCLGSQYWARNQHKKDYYAKIAILLDMVGAKGAKFAMEGVSRRYAPHTVKKVWSIANRLGYSDYFRYYDSPEIVDDHSYINRLTSIKMINIIEHDPEGDSYFGPYWHTHNDNMDIIDKKTLKAVGQTLVQVIFD